MSFIKGPLGVAEGTARDEGKRGKPNGSNGRTEGEHGEKAARWRGAQLGKLSSSSTLGSIMSLFQRVNFLLAMRADRAALPECCLPARSKPPRPPPPARRQNKRLNRRLPIRYETDVAHGGRAETQEIQHVHEALRALQVSFHGAVQKNPPQRKSGQVGPKLLKTSLHGRRLKTFLHRSAFNTCVRACVLSGCCENLRPSEG